MDYNARFYDPMLGRFTSPDSIIPDPGSVIGYNRYAYVNNNPMIYTDPSGHSPIIDDDPYGNPIVDKPTSGGTTYSWDFINNITNSGNIGSGSTGSTGSLGSTSSNIGNSYYPIALVDGELIYVNDYTMEITEYILEGEGKISVDADSPHKIGTNLMQKPNFTDLGIMFVLSVPTATFLGIAAATQLTAELGPVATWGIWGTSWGTENVAVGEFSEYGATNSEVGRVISEVAKDDTSLRILLIENTYRKQNINGSEFYSVSDRTGVFVQNIRTEKYQTIWISNIHTLEIENYLKNNSGN